MAMRHKPVVSTIGIAMRSDGVASVRRSLPEEVPVAIVFDGTTLAVMMASPADLEDFALGFALTEGVVTDASEIASFELVEHERGIEARFWLCSDRRLALEQRRRLMAGPVGCGLCGIDSIEAATRCLPKVATTGPVFSRDEFARATDGLGPFQHLHDRTRATHAAGLLLPGRGIVLAREDVGRHNALDKLVGATFRHGLAPRDGAFVVTSRLSMELVQKCAMAGCPALIAMSAPTAHAVRLAEDAGITLAAFARTDGFDLYAHAHRILQ